MNRKCRYSNCWYDGKIDIDKEQYVQSGNSYYHTKCYNTKQDINFIKQYWHDNIDCNVVYSQLIKILNQLIFENHNDSDYVKFVVMYCVEHKMNLRYPPGIKYFISNHKIQIEYQKTKIKKVDTYNFSATENNDEPSFSIKKKQQGFGSILGRK